MTRKQRQTELHRILKLSDGHRQIIKIWKDKVPGPLDEPKPKVGAFFGELIREILNKEFPTSA